MCLLATAMMLSEEATDTSRSARASRRDVAGQPEPPEALDSSVGAAGTPAAHPLRRESAASYFEEARLFRTRARVWYVLIKWSPVSALYACQVWRGGEAVRASTG